jgi:hypothetical protein
MHFKTKVVIHLIYTYININACDYLQELNLFNFIDLLNYKYLK